jgi:hypothetical protein
MHFKLAILTALSRRPDGRATLDDIRREVEALTANEDQGEEQPQPLADIDIFQSGRRCPKVMNYRLPSRSFAVACAGNVHRNVSSTHFTTQLEIAKAY